MAFDRTNSRMTQSAAGPARLTGTLMSVHGTGMLVIGCARSGQAEPAEVELSSQVGRQVVREVGLPQPRLEGDQLLRVVHPDIDLDAPVWQAQRGGLLGLRQVVLTAVLGPHLPHRPVRQVASPQ